MHIPGGHVPMGNLAMQGPLLSSGTTSNVKNMQAHNLTSTESFVAMQPQGMVHNQTGQLLPPASGAGMSSGGTGLTNSPHTMGLSQPQNIPLNTFLSSSHALSSTQQLPGQTHSAGGLHQQQGQQQGVAQNQPSSQPGQVAGMQGEGSGQHQAQQQHAPQQTQQVMQGQQPAQQNWMQRQQQQQQQGNMMHGGAPQMMPQQQHGGMQGHQQGVPQQQMQYHVQQNSMPGQQPQYGQPQSAPMQQGMGHQQQQHMQMQQQQHAQHQGQGPPGQQMQQQGMNVIPSATSQSQGSSFAGTKFSTKPWHSPEHGATRNGMVEEIIKLLKTRRPNATEDWHEKLPHMARRLEDALYHEANDLGEYSDHASLKHRLQQLALSMGGNKQQPQGKPPGGAPNQQSQQQQLANNQMRQQQFQQQQMQQQKPPFPQGAQPGQGQMPGGQQFAPQQPQFQQLARTAQAAASQYPQTGQQQVQPQQGYLSSSALEFQQQQLNSQMQQQGQHGGMPGQPVMHANVQYGNNAAGVAMGGNPSQQPVGSNGAPYMLNPNDPNNGMYAGGNMQYAQMQAGARPAGGNPAGGMPPQGQAMHGQPPMHPGGQMQPSGGNPAQPGAGQGHTEEHRKQVLKQQQQRLLLLRHASKCPHENGRCPVTPHCWSMKQLWKHIMSCKDQECKIPHCVSSRYVLSHYSKCKEPTCPVCGPVREAIKRNYERSKDIVKTTRTSNYPNNAMPPHLPPQRDEPQANKRQKRANNGKDKVDERLPPTIVIPSRPRPAPRSVYPLDPISCAIYCFTAENIQSHFKSIHEGMKLTVAKIREMCKPIIEELFRVPHAHGIFGAPVDPVMLGLADYFDVVKLPMDLGTVNKKLQEGSYRDLHHFVVDVHLTFDNAMNYNPKNSDVHMLAKSLKKEFDAKYKQKVADFERNIAIMRENEDACLICGEPNLKFEPPVYYCNGTCAQRIRRNAVFFSNNTNTYHWCNPCFNNLKEGEVVRLPDCTVSKTELSRNKKKHTEESDEGWVQCDGGCSRWVHQVCSLFNARRNISDEVSYVCPLCIQKERTAHPDKLIVQPTTKKMSAIDLPLTILSEFLEKRIYKRLNLAYKESAQRLGISENDVEKCPRLTLRQVSCLEKNHNVREGVYNRYKEKGYPTDFPCRTKCLVLFQNIDGQDVILFGMYVYEYGHKCPQPNQRRVYISYLDSVHYLRPKQYRTLVYHEILISYLDYVRARGFHTAHIWACPPQKGDDYILYVHPPDQKTPKPQILRVWYDEMLKRCVERGIVCEYTDIHTEYLADHNNDATVLPYFEGDYWVNEAEVIIKNLKSGVKDDYDESGGVGKSKRKSKSKRLVRTEVVKPMQLGKSERDPVMAKLASIIEPMKDTFFVARLHPREYAAKCAANLTAEATTAESTVQEEEKLREEALTGSDVQMPAGAEAPPAAEKKQDEEQGGKEGQSGGEDQMDDDEDDFGKAALSISQPGEGDGAPNQDGESGSKVRPQLSSSVSAMQFSDYALKRSGSELVNADGDNDGNMCVDEADSAPTPTTPSGRSSRSNRKPPKSESKTRLDEADTAETRATTPREPENADTADDSKIESKEDEVGSARVKEEPYAPPAVDGTPLPSKGSGLVKPSSDANMGERCASSSNVSASEETKIKSESEGDGDTEASVERAVSKVVLSPPVLIMAGEDMPDLKDDTEDVDDIQENEHFETRQSFLNLCQGNHYQFDQLRRAKHTSMMVLYHLHNPDAPKFVPSCTLCHIDILTGYRHHCDTCEIDFCQNCVTNSVVKIHQHPLRPMAIANSTPQQLTEEQRKERARSVQLHMQLLQHASNCAKCESKNCQRMKVTALYGSVYTIVSDLIIYSSLSILCL